MKTQPASLFFFSLFIFNFASLSSFAESSIYLDSASSELVYEKNEFSKERIKEKEKKPFQSTVGLQLINGFNIRSDHIRQFFLNSAYSPSGAWSFSLSQAFNHHYFLNPNSNDRGLWIQDMSLFAHRQFKDLPYKSRLKASLSSTLPFSDYSQTARVWTVSTLSLSWSLAQTALFGFPLKGIKNITFFIKPIARYYVSEYTTSPTAGQSRGGEPLPQFLFGLQSAGLRVNITDYFSFSGSHGQWLAYPYKTAYKRDRHSPYKRSYPKHYYLFSLAGNVTLKKQWDLSLSYTHLDRLNRQGRREAVLFDDQLSVWAVSLSYLFAFGSS